VATGLRERKKQQTRELIAETARRLFSERGFEHVSVAEIARVADVSEKTVFNYFPTKEGLVYWRLESFETELLDTIRSRAVGESVLEAFGRFAREPRGMLGKYDPETQERLAAVSRMIASSPALLAREQQIFTGYTASLAALIAEETGAAPDDLLPGVIARSLAWTHRLVFRAAFGRVIAGEDHAAVAADLREQARRAYDQLEHGLRDYGVR